MNTKTQSPEFAAYYNGWRGRTPANAARLAAADHDATPSGLRDFSHDLRVAGRMCDEHAALRAALEKIAQQTAPRNTLAYAMAAMARAALDKVQS